MKFSIRTYNEGQQLSSFHFFILNKGLNCGKPDREPWCNCFVFESEEEHITDRCYWLCYGLWFTGKFRRFLVGSVIEFIRIDDVKQIIELADAATYHLGQKFYEALDMLHQVESQSLKTYQRLKDLQRMKIEILRALVAV